MSLLTNLLISLLVHLHIYSSIHLSPYLSISFFLLYSLHLLLYSSIFLLMFIYHLVVFYCLSIDLPICLSVCLSVYLSICLCNYWCIDLCLYLFIYLKCIHLSIYVLNIRLVYSGLISHSISCISSLQIGSLIDIQLIWIALSLVSNAKYTGLSLRLTKYSQGSPMSHPEPC